MWAAISGQLEIARALVEGGADVRAKDRMGRTALVYAKERGFAEVVRMLMEAEKKAITD
ncbi:MAG: ankyrin repeat domain-containing protein [Candidatus Manganitrophus sp.]|nr:ankyrin repeat domain-containing protein [Candidatus Manganitrophus sp.]MDC4227387.1 ankyrin repeat domain-containing protein [Candidatus Manganitrophus sp.]WDT69842.1 MAG: ankyrin repeat domain-containing protein [Candidatus Manganitrophus sp.]WDT78528.1 MAG: ankyrin repeat domain-containing protein [Candidatus Manganitrophus sp.]